VIEVRDIVDFWRDAGPACWFRGGAAFDAQCRARFLDAHLAASRRECDHWMAHADGALALLLLLDQIPRNVYRGSAHSYATDPLARQHATRAIQAGFDRQVEPSLQVFFYLPFEHSEDLGDQRRSLELHQQLAGDSGDRWARLHLELIERFGRFPHRNAVLGRESTAAEQAYLDQGGFSG